MLFLSTVWPEPRSSAAGVRTAALLGAFARAGYSLAVAASAARNEASAALESGGVAAAAGPVPCFSVPLNRVDALDAALAARAPSVVVFDRFTSEEAFSWRVRERVPGAARVLDMQDCHALRRARARAVEDADRRGGRGEKKSGDGGAADADAAASDSETAAASDSETAVSAALAARPDASDRDAVREASAVYRSDLTLVCSPVEGRLLRASLGGEGGPGPGLGGGGGGGGFERLLVPAPLFASRPALSGRRRRGFAERRHFVAIGSFLHPPNVDSLLWLAGRRGGRGVKKGGERGETRKPEAENGETIGKNGSGEGGRRASSSSATPIWDLLSALPGMEGAELHVYGSYASRCPAALEAHDPARRVFVHGRAPNLAPLARSRVLLAPLRFGAGLKGKVADAWMRGTPVVTTPIGGEGMALEQEEEEGEEEEEEGERDGEEEEEEGERDGEEVGVAAEGEEGGHGRRTRAGGRTRKRGGRRSGGAGGESGPPLLLPWGGSRTSETASSFAAEAARLYLDEDAWTRASEEGARLHDALYFAPRPADAAVATVDALVSGPSPSPSSHASLLEFRRARDFVGAALWADSARATEYFSRWIELKEKEKERKKQSVA